MVSYSGPVEVLAPDGNLITRARATLTSRLERGGLQSWAGNLHVPFVAATELWEFGQVTLRLPNGREGTALLKSLRLSGAAGAAPISLPILGSGEAPF